MQFEAIDSDDKIATKQDHKELVNCGRADSLLAASQR